MQVEIAFKAIDRALNRHPCTGDEICSKSVICFQITLFDDFVIHSFLHCVFYIHVHEIIINNNFMYYKIHNWCRVFSYLAQVGNDGGLWQSALGFLCGQQPPIFYLVPWMIRHSILECKQCIISFMTTVPQIIYHLSTTTGTKNKPPIIFWSFCCLFITMPWMHAAHGCTTFFQKEREMSIDSQTPLGAM